MHDIVRTLDSVPLPRMRGEHPPNRLTASSRERTIPATGEPAQLTNQVRNR